MYGLRSAFLTYVVAHGALAMSASIYDIAKTNEDGYVDYAEDSYELTDISDFYKKVFGDDYITNWNSLKRYDNSSSSNRGSGSVKEQRYPYLDSWYPEISGGTNVNIGSNNMAIVKDKVFVDDPDVMGALDKYDKAFYSGRSIAAKWEKDNHSRKSPSWFGHCNGTSAAVARFQNPSRSVYRPKGCNKSSSTCTKFTPQDIRALLAEINMNAKAKFISGNRCSKTKDQIKQSPRKFNSLPMDSCQDVNPASFHIALVNFIARQGQTLIFDKSQDNEVWNYPLFRYSFNYRKVSITTALNTLGVDRSNWVFNSAARDFIEVNMSVFYRDPSTRDFTNSGDTDSPEVKKEYVYILELDTNDNIIGGEWSEENYKDHPDFLWMPFEPAMPTGTSKRGNRMVANDKVIELWAESMGFSQTRPFKGQPEDIAYDVRFYPEESDSWGNDTGYYQVLLNGIDAAFVFRDSLGDLQRLSLIQNQR